MIRALKSATPKSPRFAYPVARKGTIIGLPYQGTHTQFGNWESDRAVDIRVPKGTPVFAVRSGVIGKQIGPLNSRAPQLAGQRLHLNAKGDEYYYAHLSKLAVKAGQHVVRGQLLGYSGVANGTPHLHFASKVANPIGVLKQTKYPPPIRTPRRPPGHRTHRAGAKGHA